MWNGTMFVDLAWPLNASSLLSASAELLVSHVPASKSHTDGEMGNMVNRYRALRATQCTILIEIKIHWPGWQPKNVIVHSSTVVLSVLKKISAVISPIFKLDFLTALRARPLALHNRQAVQHIL